MSTFLIETTEEDTTTAVAKLVAEYLDSGKVRAGVRSPPPPFLSGQRQATFVGGQPESAQS